MTKECALPYTSFLVTVYPPNPPSMSAETEGKVYFKVGSETYQTWYKTFGHIKNSEHRPVVIVHGGPGMSHHYLLFVEAALHTKPIVANKERQAPQSYI